MEIASFWTKNFKMKMQVAAEAEVELSPAEVDFDSHCNKRVETKRGDHKENYFRFFCLDIQDTGNNSDINRPGDVNVRQCEAFSFPTC